MNFEDLKKFIEIEDERLQKCYDYPDKDKRILARTVKRGEEYGELCDEILSHTDLQRKEKLMGRDPEHLAEEFADIFIVAMLLAKTMDVDIEKALIKKIEKIEGRHINNK